MFAEKENARLRKEVRLPREKREMLEKAAIHRPVVKWNIHCRAVDKQRRRLLRQFHGGDVLQVSQGGADLAHRLGRMSSGKGEIFQYINGFYNPRRRHSSLRGKSRLAYERNAA